MTRRTAPSCSTVWTCATTAWPTCATSSPLCSRSRCCSRPASRRTSPTGGRVRPSGRSRRRRGRRARHAALRRRAPASRTGARVPQGRAAPDPRRAHKLGGHENRSSHPRSDGSPHGGPHCLPGHAPVERARDVRPATAAGAGTPPGGGPVAGMSSTLSRKPPKAVLWGKLSWHPAAAAWTAFGAGAAEPESIEGLRNGKKAGTYRLVGAGPAGESIIAQRSPVARAVIERVVYEQILPRLPVTAPRYYGSGADGRDFVWFFLEDVGEE